MHFKFLGQAPQTEPMEERLEDMVYPLLEEHFGGPENAARYERQRRFLREAIDFAVFYRLPLEIEHLPRCVRASLFLRDISFHGYCLHELRDLVRKCDELSLLCDPNRGGEMQLMFQVDNDQ